MKYRLRIVRPPIGPGHQPTFDYIVRDKRGHISYMSAGEVPLALSNLIHSDCAGMRFKLEDAFDGSEAAKELRAVLKAQYEKNPAIMPTVEVLS